MKTIFGEQITDKEILKILKSRENDKSMSFEEAYEKIKNYKPKPY